jgi:hypothetical protein
VKEEGFAIGRWYDFFRIFSLCGYEIPKKNVLVELRYLRGLTGVYVESS